MTKGLYVLSVCNKEEEEVWGQLESIRPGKVDLSSRHELLKGKLTKEGLEVFEMNKYLPEEKEPPKESSRAVLGTPWCLQIQRWMD